MEYIYLDWNVIQYMKHRTVIVDKLIDGSAFEKVVTELSKKYKFPFSEGHLVDLAVSFKPENQANVENDLNYLKKLSGGYVLDKNLNIVKPSDNDVSNLFDEIVHEDKKELNFKITCSSHSVDMNKLSKKVLFRPLLELNNGILDSSVMSSFISKILENIDNPEFYKNFRDEVAKIKATCDTTDTIIDQESDYFKKVIPFLEFLVTKDLQILKNNFYGAMKSFASINERNYDKFPLGQKIEQAYMLLDFHPEFGDEIKKGGKNKHSNMRCDAKHLYFASQAKYFVTEDKMAFKKASFVSDVLSLKVKVLKMGEFCREFY